MLAIPFRAVGRCRPVLAALAAAIALCAAAPAHADAADPAFWYATAPDGSARIKLHFFWTTRCEHCQAAKPFIEALPARLPYVELVSRPTDGDATNARLQYATASALGADPVSVPAIFFCGEAQIGYDSAATTGAALVQRLDACRARLAADPSLLTKPVAVIAPGQRSSSSAAGAGVAIAIGAAFVALIVLGIVLARRSAAAKARADAARRAQRGDGAKRRRH